MPSMSSTGLDSPEAGRRLRCDGATPAKPVCTVSPRQAGPVGRFGTRGCTGGLWRSDSVPVPPGRWAVRETVVRPGGPPARLGRDRELLVVADARLQGVDADPRAHGRRDGDRQEVAALRRRGLRALELVDDGPD